MHNLGSHLTGARALNPSGAVRMPGGRYGLYVAASAMANVTLHYAPDNSSGTRYVPVSVATAEGLTIVDLPSGFYDFTCDATMSDGRVSLIGI